MNYVKVWATLPLAKHENPQKITKFNLLVFVNAILIRIWICTEQKWPSSKPNYSWRYSSTPVARNTSNLTTELPNKIAIWRRLCRKNCHPTVQIEIQPADDESQRKLFVFHLNCPDCVPWWYCIQTLYVIKFPRYGEITFYVFLLTFRLNDAADWRKCLFCLCFPFVLNALITNSSSYTLSSLWLYI